MDAPKLALLILPIRVGRISENNTILSLLFQIFQVLEHPVEKEKLLDLQDLVITERENFVKFIFNGSWNSVVHRENVDLQLLDYEKTVAVAATSGINMSTKDVTYQWSYVQAVFFTSTILTTIGKFFFWCFQLLREIGNGHLHKLEYKCIYFFFYLSFFFVGGKKKEFS